MCRRLKEWKKHFYQWKRNVELPKSFIWKTITRKERQWPPSFCGDVESLFPEVSVRGSNQLRVWRSRLTRAVLSEWLPAPFSHLQRKRAVSASSSVRTRALTVRRTMDSRAWGAGRLIVTHDVLDIRSPAARHHAKVSGSRVRATGKVVNRRTGTDGLFETAMKGLHSPDKQSMYSHAHWPQEWIQTRRTKQRPLCAAAMLLINLLYRSCICRICASPSSVLMLQKSEEQ